MSFLGKEIRMNRLISKKDNRYFGLTVDHAMARGVLPGLGDIKNTLDKLIAGGPDSITMHKGIADTCFTSHAGKIPLILKCSTFSPYQPDADTVVADVEEAVRYGADAISIGCIVGGDTQSTQIAAVGKIAKDAASYGMPLVAHIYPRGNRINQSDRCSEKAVAYAVRVGAELGVDIVKTNYTGSIDSFAKVVEACPAKVVVAGGTLGNTPKDYFQLVHDALSAGAIGITFGRCVFQYQDPTSLIKSISALIHKNLSITEALQMLDDLEHHQ
ncbi:class I fructose-bisphosphate aldolase [Pectinatus frisingensis]|uniref:class I fructose-bisphosphate aldolase n=1 Tax=Pectinatus frisingensis TaxID=865 RepID=UPI0015F720E2|nr:2-amino-3,7-dideoxy-D-threo-hept-6-ulosonate synthase [Pectinatus frisingensis]